MKGLLIKDIYIAQENIVIMLICMLGIYLMVSFFSVPAVIILVTVASFGSLTVVTIIADTTSKWNRFSVTIPVSRKEIVLSKYILHMAFLLIGFVIGMTFAVVISGIKNEMQTTNWFLFIFISIIFGFLSGSISIPCSYILADEKATVISMLLSYLGTSAIIGGTYSIARVFFTLPDHLHGFILVMLILSVSIFALSYIYTSKMYTHKDI